MGRKLTRPRPKQGALLARLRKAAGLSQSRLAQIIGQSQGNIAFWEVTDKAPPGDVLPKLAKALGVEIADLIIDAASCAAPQQKSVPTKLRRLFDQILQLPPRQQNAIIKVFAVFLDNFHLSSRHKSIPKSKSKSKSKPDNLNSPAR